jgi:hypothetical protein
MAYETRTRCSPPGCQPLSCRRVPCDRNGHSGAAGATSGPVCSALTATLRARVPGADLPDAAEESASAAPGCPPSAEALDAPAEISEAKDQLTRDLRR